MDNIAQKLEDLKSALVGGVASVEISAARSLIANFKSQLDGSSDPALAQVGADLGGLHTVLGDQPLDPAAIGQHLTKVGASVRSVSVKPGAPSVLGDIAAKLESEGGKLGA